MWAALLSLLACAGGWAAFGIVLRTWVVEERGNGVLGRVLGALRRRAWSRAVLLAACALGAGAWGWQRAQAGDEPLEATPGGRLSRVRLPLPQGAPAAGGSALYIRHCAWCHGESGRGDGPSTAGMVPRPRDFVRADYKIRSTAHGRLPTDEDLFRTISRGIPGTPMPAWERFLSPAERWELARHVKSFSPRFENEPREVLAVPGAEASAERGRASYRAARCALCHGEEGRGDGPVTVTLDRQWGLPAPARDLTRGWTFKGGHEPADIYRRITGGMNGTPMGPYADLLPEGERWDLAHFVASLDREPEPPGDDSVVRAAGVGPDAAWPADAPEWRRVRALVVPRAAQIVLDPPLRWWVPTSDTCAIRAVHDGRAFAVLVEWDDATHGGDLPADGLVLRFSPRPAARPGPFLGAPGDPALLWVWQEGMAPEEWSGSGDERVEVLRARFEAHAAWSQGRWRVCFRGRAADVPGLVAGGPVPMLVSIQDGSRPDRGPWKTLPTVPVLLLEVGRGPAAWFSALAFGLGALLGGRWILRGVAP